MRKVVPTGDLYLSKTLEDAENTVKTILDRGYGRVFVGGGDGTLVSTMNLLREQAGETAPAIGVLKLGTGNAVARVLGARSPVRDAAFASGEGRGVIRPVDWVECDDGQLTPFAGMGWDGDILNDYRWLKKNASNRVSKKVVETVWGYLGAMVTRSVPRAVKNGPAVVRITSSQDAFRVFRDPETGRDVEERIKAGEVLYEGRSPVVSVGTVPCFGFGFTMFPFAERRRGYMQVRAGDVPLPTVLANLFPKVWKGSFRHDNMFDLLVKDVRIEGDRPMNYQVGGDAAGTKEELNFRVADRPPPLFELDRARA